MTSIAVTQRAEIALPALRGGGLASLCLVLALFAPTSRGGSIDVALGLLPVAAVTGVLLLRMTLGGRWPSPALGWVAAAIPVVLLAATIVSPFPDLTLGALVAYVALAMTFASDLRSLRSGEGTRRLLLVLNVVVVVLGIGIVGGTPAVVDAIVANYSWAYPDLVPNMTAWRKPVVSFGSHSTAAFMLYLLFHLQFETYRARGGAAHLVMAVANVTLGLALASVTAAALMSVALVRLVAASTRRPAVALAGVAIGVAAAASVAALLQGFSPFEALQLALQSDTGGFRGRYAAGGNLLANLDFLREHPLRPVGVTFSPTLFYGDSGLVEYLLRGSLPLLALMYGGLLLFLWRNVQDSRQRWHVLGVVLFTELGFTILTYTRMLLILPAVVIYLNSLNRAPVLPATEGSHA